jgi:hypothetical protein
LVRGGILDGLLCIGYGSICILGGISRGKEYYIGLYNLPLCIGLSHKDGSQRARRRNRGYAISSISYTK